MKQVIAVILKEFKLLIKEPGGLILLFVLPAMFILVLSVALQGAFSSPDTLEKISVIVVNQDKGDLGNKLIEAIDASGHFVAVTKDGNKPWTEKRVETLVGQSIYPVAIIIPDRINEAIFLKEKITVEILIDPTFSKQATWGIKGTVKEFVHLTMIAGKITEANKKGEAIDELKEAVDDVKEKIESCAKDLKEATNPKKIMALMRRHGRGKKDKEDDDKYSVDSDTTDNIGKEEDYEKDAKKAVKLIEEKGVEIKQRYIYATGSVYEKEPNSVQQSVPGWTIFALFWIAQILAINILHERQTGAFKRVMVAPISFTKYMAAKTIPFVIINIIQAVLMFSLGVYVLPQFGCPELEIKNIPALAIVTFAISYSAIGFGIMMASLAKTIFLSASISASVLIIMTAIGGVMVPKFIMPKLMQSMSEYVPHGWALEGYLHVLVKNGGIRDVLPHVGVLVLFGTAFMLFAMIRFYRKNLSH